MIYYYVIYIVIKDRNNLIEPTHEKYKQWINYQENSFLCMAWSKDGNGEMYFITKTGNIYFVENYKKHIKSNYPTPLDVFSSEKNAILMQGKYKSFWKPINKHK